MTSYFKIITIVIYVYTHTHTHVYAKTNGNNVDFPKYKATREILKSALKTNRDSKSTRNIL